jgi:hypothetical protein
LYGISERVLQGFHVLGVFDVFTQERLAKTEKCHHLPELTHGNVNNSYPKKEANDGNT